MAFPEVPRARYEINFLDQVICRVKFPPILTIDTETPAIFQEKLRERFPLYQVRATTKLPGNIPPELAKLIQNDPILAATREHWFGTADNVFWAGLTRGGLSLHCREYGRWEEFRERLLSPLEALRDVYQPAFCTHTCLRYRNAIRRSQLPNPNAPWSQWLNPWVCGPLGSVESVDQVQSTQTKTLFRLADDIGYVDATFGLAEDTLGPEKVFVIEAHVYTDTRLELNDVPSSLDTLHEQARRFYRWCISDDLHHALRPGSLSLGGV